jgi:hypothetical protein
VDATPLFKPDGRSLTELLDDLDKLIAESKSTWPGRIIVNRRKTLALLKLMEQRIADSPDTARRAQAEVAILDFEDVAANSRFYKGANIWETFSFYGPRERFREMAADLRAKLSAV